MKSLFRVAAELQSFMLEQQWQFCFIGGIALQRWGQPRLTVDVDVSLLTGLGREETYVDILCAQYQNRIPEARDFALENRVLLLQSNDGIPIDIALAGFQYEEEVVTRATNFKFLEDIRLRTCSVEDLVVLKAFANRTRDWADIESVIARQRSLLDTNYITGQLGPLCDLKKDPQILDKLNQLLDENR